MLLAANQIINYYPPLIVVNEADEGFFLLFKKEFIYESLLWLGGQ